MVSAGMSQEADAAVAAGRCERGGELALAAATAGRLGRPGLGAAAAAAPAVPPGRDGSEGRPALAIDGGPEFAPSSTSEYGGGASA